MQQPLSQAVPAKKEHLAARRPQHRRPAKVILLRHPLAERAGTCSWIFRDKTMVSTYFNPFATPRHGDRLCVAICGQQWDGIHRGCPQQPVQRHCQPCQGFFGWNGKGRRIQNRWTVTTITTITGSFNDSEATSLPDSLCRPSHWAEHPLSGAHGSNVVQNQESADLRRA